MPVRRPSTRDDGSHCWIDQATGEVFLTMAEAAGLWSVDLELRGLLAEGDSDAA